MTRVELRQELNKISMKKKQEPAVMFEMISAVENRYNAASIQVSEEDFIAVILDAAPAEYQAVLTSEQRHRGDQLRKEDLEDAMTQHWRQLNKGNKRSASDEADNKMSLAVMCYKCDKEGHKANKCPTRQSRGGRGDGRGGHGAGRGGRGADPEVEADVSRATATTVASQATRPHSAGTKKRTRRKGRRTIAQVTGMKTLTPMSMATPSSFS
jgi:hypothetical protein